MQPTVYIETTIPSFYYEARQDADMVARRNWTREWWDQRSASYQLVTSEAVLDELGHGDYPGKKEAAKLMAAIPVLPVETEIAEIIEAYITHGVMPRDPAGDALHLALVSYWKCEFLLTWNCGHLANANKFAHIRRVNTMLGLFVPTLATPLELLGRDDDHEG